MNINKALRRERKQTRNRNGMQVDGKSVFTIQEEQRKRAEEIKRNRKQKENLIDSLLTTE